MGHHVVQDVRRHGLKNVRSDEARSDSMDANVVFAQFAGPGARHTDDARFRGHVICLPEVSIQRHHGSGTENHTSALTDHVRNNGTRHQENALEVDVNYRVPRLFKHAFHGGGTVLLHQLRVAHKTGVVDEHIDATPLLDYFTYGGIDSGRIG